MTNEHRRRIEQALAETIAIIEKEEGRGPVNRPEYMQQVLDHAIAHRAKLLAMLAN